MLTIDITLSYQWDKDTAQWHVTGTGKMKSKIGYSWSDIADGSQSDGITTETFSRNNGGDFLDDVTAALVQELGNSLDIFSTIIECGTIF